MFVRGKQTGQHPLFVTLEQTSFFGYEAVVVRGQHLFLVMKAVWSTQLNFQSI